MKTEADLHQDLAVEELQIDLVPFSQFVGEYPNDFGRAPPG